MKKMLLLATVLLIAEREEARAQQQQARDRQALVRGNKPGEWRYWGGDAWSTRYSALDQINASNFNNLQMAWQWKADGVDEYYRTTPL